MPTKDFVRFAGFTWNTGLKPAPPAQAAPPTLPQNGDPAYGPNLWVPSNVAIDASGNLTLTVARDSGYQWNGEQFVPDQGTGQAWAAAQAALCLEGRQLTYGTFCVTVIAGTVGTPDWTPFTGACTAATADTNTIFGAFTYDPLAPAPHGEIDVVEIGYQAQNEPTGWINQQPGGPSANSDAQFCVQPWDGAGGTGMPDWSNLRRFALDPTAIPGSGEVTFAAVWKENAPVRFYAAYGAFTSATFPFDSAPFRWVSGVNGPAPTPTLSFYLILWPYGGPSTNTPETFTVTHVEVPLAESPAT